MKKSSLGNINQSQLIDKAVRQLKRCGLDVRSTRVGRVRPVIEIERPESLCPGFTITTRYGHNVATLNVASLEGCLITWRA